jgi:hypothetical protein
METSLPTPMPARVFVNLLEGSQPVNRQVFNGYVEGKSWENQFAGWKIPTNFMEV